MRITRLQLIASMLAAGLLLTACGGGGSSAPAPVPDVPDEALASSAGFTQWAKGLRVDEQAEPLNMGRLEVAPSSESDDPVPLD
jgi:hypothetical protein